MAKAIVYISGSTDADLIAKVAVEMAKHDDDKVRTIAVESTASASRAWLEVTT